MKEQNDQCPQGKSPTTRMMAMPADANATGDIFGGWILSQIDVAGAIVGFKRAKGRIVTVALNSVKFHRPVFVGDVVSCFAEIEHVGNSSITIKVEVFAERPDECAKVTEACIVYVAVDDNRKPRHIPAE